MRAGHLRVVAALGAVLMLAMGPTPASAGSTYAKHYVAAGGGPTTMDTPLASCGDTEVTPSLGGACFTVTGTVTGPTTVHVHVDDVASQTVAGYWNLGFADHGYFCNDTDVVVPNPGTYNLGVWVGGVDVAPAGCGMGQATTGWIFLTTSP